MSWYRPQEWISVLDRLFFRSHRDGAAAPVPGCLCGVGKGTSLAPPRASPAPPRASPCSPAPSLTHTPPTPSAPSPHPPRRPALPSPPFPAPVPTPSPRHLPPLPANLPKPSDPRHIFFSFFYIFCHNFGDSAPEIPKSASLFCVFMQFDQNIRKNKALFQGLTLHFFLYFPGFYVVLLVLISCHGEIKKKRV